MSENIIVARLINLFQRVHVKRINSKFYMSNLGFCYSREYCILSYFCGILFEFLILNIVDYSIYNINNNNNNTSSYVKRLLIYNS